MDFETLKQSSSNFDKLTKAIEANLNPEADWHLISPYNFALKLQMKVMRIN